MNMSEQHVIDVRIF